MDRKLEWLEAMRACAACWVLLHHANQSVAAFVGPLGLDQTVFLNGYLGVDFFFVLSGFIIAHSSNRLIQTGRGFADYATARLIRIYVPYVPIGVAMLALYNLLPDLSAADRSPGIVTSLTLLPTANPPALSVAWTLIHEILFYALFSLIFISRRLLLVVLGLWSMLIAAWFWTGQPLEREGMGYLLSPLNLCFLLGVSVYYLARNGVGGKLAMACAVSGFVVILFEATRVVPNRWVLAPGFAGLIVGASSDWAQKWSPGRIAIFLGAASYSIYLVHNPLLSVAVRVLGEAAPGISPLPAFLVITSIALAGGVGYHAFYEVRGLAIVRGLLKVRAATVAQTSSKVVMDRDAA